MANVKRRNLSLVIDQGTHASRALLFDRKGDLIFSAHQDIALMREGRKVEQDPEEILSSVQNTLAQALQFGDEITSAAITTQRSTVVAWDRDSGAPLAPALSWQDTRAQATLSHLRGHETEIEQRTGLRLSAHYGASKLQWLLTEVPEVRQGAKEGTLALGPLAAFLLFHLLEGQPLAVDHANASRTLLWSLHTRDWDDELLRYFALDRSLLPRCRPIRHRYGVLRDTSIPLTAASGDQNAALFAEGPAREDSVYMNIGTGAFALLPTGQQRIQHAALLSGIADSDAGTNDFYLEGTVNGAGAALDWAQQRWQNTIDFNELDDWLAQADDPPVFLNAVGGLGSPWWTSRLAAHFTDASDVNCNDQWPRCVCAIIESIAFMLIANLELLRETGRGIRRLRVSGGLGRLDGLCQRLANLSELPVERTRQTEATGRGAAWLACARPTDWTATPADHFEPRRDPDLHTRYRRFRRALELALRTG